LALILSLELLFRDAGFAYWRISKFKMKTKKSELRNVLCG